MYLLDTTVVVEYLRGSEPAANYLANLISPTISIITQAEIYQGANNKKEFLNWDKTLNRFTILTLNKEISDKSINLIRNYHLSHGLIILDALIAATAVTFNLTLVTENKKHFQFIKGLQVKLWPKE